MKADPHPQHQWLQRLLGDWTSESDAPAEPGKPPAKLRGTETGRRLGDLWVVLDGRGDMPGGGTAQMMMTLGFDPSRNRFVGTWVGSMMTHLWVYEGSLDAGGNVLTLNTEGPDFATGGSAMAKYKDVIEFRGDDHRILTGNVMGADGKWTVMMTAHYHRKK